MKKICEFSFIVVLLAVVVGCNKSVAITGKVTFDGAPIAEGNIIFLSVDGHEQDAAGNIIDGRYTISMPPGKKRVEIFAMRIVKGKFDESNPGEKVPLREAYIPAKYNTQSKLTFEVTGDSAEKDFKLTGD